MVKRRWSRSSTSLCTLRHREDLEFGGHLVSVDLGPDGQLLVATSAADPASSAAVEEQPGRATFPRSRPAQPYAVTVRSIGAGGDDWHIADLPVSFPSFQPLPEGRLLAVGSRARWSHGSAEHNALVIDAGGAVVDSFCIGDGVEHLQVSSSGVIWAGYFDEGIFGNYGWGEPDGPRPLGQAGLVSWSEAGAVRWEYQPPSGTDGIADCYAMNVVDETVWCCYYTDFPIVRIDSDHVVRSWPTIAPGARAMAVHGSIAVLVGGYREDRRRVVVSDLDAGTSSTLRLSLPDGEEVPDRASVLARGSEIHAVVDGRWFAIDLSEIV